MAAINEGAQLFKVHLSRPNSSVSWGFRLQGGADFSTPLSIQLVQPDSVAERAGLQARDGILQINGNATEVLAHETAKAEIVRAGNDIEFLVQRGAVTTWRPTTTPMSELKPSELQTHTLPGEAPPLQKTSLAANKQPIQHIGSTHNRSARPFGASQVQGRSTISPETHISIRDSFPDAAGHPNTYGRNQLQQEYLKECEGVVPDVNYDVQPSMRQQPTSPGSGVVHAQYNTPLGIYSNKNVGDSFQQQADVMKNDFGNMSLHDGEPDSKLSITLNNNNVIKSPIRSPTHFGPIKPAVYSPTRAEPIKSPVYSPVQAEPIKSGVYSPVQAGPIKSPTYSPVQAKPIKSLVSSPTQAEPIKSLGSSPTQAEPIKSAVQLALEQEQQPEVGLYKGGSVQSRSFKMLENELVEGERRMSTTNGTERVLPPGVKSVQAPKTNPNMKMTGPRYKQPTTKCYVCGNFISGMFVRVKEHCLHSECLKCAQCNRSLKNIGYIWVQDKLYCVQHARELTRPPGGGYTAYVIDAPEGV